MEYSSYKIENIHQSQKVHTGTCITSISSSTQADASVMIDEDDVLTLGASTQRKC